MKNIGISQACRAEQLIVGVEPESDVVVIAVEAPQEPPAELGWLVYGATATRAREIAQILREGADLLEGKQVDDGRYDANAEQFKDHHAR